jgi:hypothetical protein
LRRGLPRLLLDEEGARAGLALEGECIHQHDDAAEPEGTMGQRRAGAGPELATEPDQRREATTGPARSPIRNPLDVMRAGCEGHGHGWVVPVRFRVQMGEAAAIMRCAAMA